MSREQKRLAAIFLCIMGIMGTVMAMKGRQPAPGTESDPSSAAVMTEVQPSGK